jgi:hypothetical protein
VSDAQRRLFCPPGRVPRRLDPRRRVDEASACFAWAAAVSDQVGDHAGRALGAYGDVFMAAQDGDYARARSLFDDARAAFERLGVWLATGLVLAGGADCDARLGNIGRRLRRIPAAAAAGETTGEIGCYASRWRDQREASCTTSQAKPLPCSAALPVNNG